MKLNYEFIWIIELPLNYIMPVNFKCKKSYTINEVDKIKKIKKSLIILECISLIFI